jgi:hypothetical protein
MRRDDCRCIHDLKNLELVDHYAEDLAEEIAESFGGTCSQMMDFFVERLIARVVHMQALSHDETLGGDPSTKLLDAVQQHIHRLSGVVPAALKVILDEARMKEGATNARH